MPDLSNTKLPTSLLVLLAIFFSLLSEQALAAYCDASGSNLYHYIKGVQVGSINNIPTGNSIYADYTSLSTTMVPEISYPVTITRGNPWDDVYDKCGAWVDWNQDEDFYDVGEEIVMSLGIDPCTFTGTITPPAGAVLGNTRMRIRIVWNEVPQPCGGSNYGEVEDYTITIAPDDGDCDTITIGTDSSIWAYPIYTVYHDSRTQVIYLASEIGSEGAITALGLDVATLPGQTMNNWTIRMQHTTMSSYSTASFESTGWTVVYQGNESIGSTGWRTFNFSTPFEYNGSDNLLVDFSHNNSSSSTYGMCKSSAPGGTRSAYARSNSGYGAPLDWSGTTSPTVSGTTSIPNVKLTICGNPPPLTVSISGYVKTADGVRIKGAIVSASTGPNTVTDALGQYTLTLPSPFSGTITPSQTEWTFSPSSRTYSSVITDQVNQDFTGTYTVNYGGGSGTSFSPYLIYNAAQLNAIGAKAGDWGSNFRLMDDIDLSGYDGKEGRPSFNRIGYYINNGVDHVPFTGVFDGSGHIISNFTFDSNCGIDAVGIFSYVRFSTTQIKNVTLTNVDVNTTSWVGTGALIGFMSDAKASGCSVQGGTVSGDSDVGGLIGIGLNGTIEDCDAEVSVSGDLWIGGLVGQNTSMISDCHASCIVTGNTECGILMGNSSSDVTRCSGSGSVTIMSKSAGGLAGKNSGTIEYCFSTADVTGTGADEIGGLVGRNLGAVSNSYATGDVSGTDDTGGLVGLLWKTSTDVGTITNCYSTGHSNWAGLIGRNIDGVITGSFWDTQTSGRPYNPSLPWGTPKTTFQMQMESTFTYTGWDFATPLWKICEGADYPRLSWEQCWIQQGLIEKWVAFYHNHEQLSIIDVAKDIAVDDLGNVYVTGESYNSVNKYDYATIKYAPDGDELWVARYNGPANKGDRVVAIAVDNAGNTCVTGRSSGDGTGTDYATVKYDPNGSELWIVRYNNQENLPDNVEDIAVDDSGNVYVTGKSYTDLGGADFCTIKYDANSVELWVATYNGLMHYSDGAEALALDDSGNVYVTGSSIGYGTGDDYATVKYDSNGVEQWVARYNGPADDHDYAYAIDLDDSGNVYITGRSIGNGSGPDTATVKYDVNGTELWVARYNGPGNDYDEALSIVTDDSGNVYVGGSSEGVGTSRDYIIIKYDPNGTELWVARYNGPEDLDDIAAEIALDNAGNVYITGASNFSMFTMPPCDATTIKYDTNGNELWNIEYSTSEFSPDLAYGIAVDSSRNVYIAGSSNNGSAYLTARYAHCSYPGDLDNDFDVDFGDYAILTMRWLDEDCGQCGRADLTGNEDVGFDDLKKYADNWLSGL